MKPLRDRRKGPFEVLGVTPFATDEEVRAAWLAAVRRHPPDRDPEGFHRVREAYELLREEEDRMSVRMFGMPEVETLSDLARRFEGEPRRTGFGPWRDVLRERAP